MFRVWNLFFSTARHLSSGSIPRLLLCSGRDLRNGRINSLLLLEYISVDCLFLGVFWLQILQPFAAAVTDAPLTHEHECCKLTVMINMVTKAVAILDKLPHTSPHPFSRCRCLSWEQFIIRNPTFAKYWTLVLQQLRRSQNASTRTCLRASGISPEFKHCAMDGANSSMVVKRSLLRPLEAKCSQRSLPLEAKCSQCCLV